MALDFGHVRAAQVVHHLRLEGYPPPPKLGGLYSTSHISIAKRRCLTSVLAAAQAGSLRQRAPGAGGWSPGPPPSLRRGLPAAREQEQVSTPGPGAGKRRSSVA